MYQPDSIGVLDQGYVRIVDHMGDDLSIVRSARVSFDTAWRAGKDEGSDQRLINYLWHNHHTTPFESVTFTFEVKAPIFVFRQWHRHRTQSYNEMSARYTELPEEFYIPYIETVGAQSKINKQGRDIDNIDDLNAFFEKRVVQINMLEEHCQEAFELYKALLDDEWPRELARMVLPFNTYSKMFCTMNLLNLFRFLTLRCDSHAQYEIRVYANAMLELIEPIVPVALNAWKNSQ